MGFFTFLASSGATHGGGGAGGGACSCAAMRPKAKIHNPNTRQLPATRAILKEGSPLNPLIPTSPFEPKFGEAAKSLPQDRTYFTC
jgi:hypothetical protein